MSEVKDPALKLFGKKIPLQESHVSFEAGDKSDKGAQIRAESEEMDAYKVTEVEAGDLSNKSSSFNDFKEDNNQTSSQENKPEEDQAETDTVGEEKILKKPDKILPCPRCNSLDTKFCYYNNYNVNQPRHFCKNCQRYWTAGGTMRNVPVGAGRRKNKHPSSQYHHIMKENGSVLKFGPEVPLCDSMTSVNRMDQKGKLEMGPVSTIEIGEESSSCTTSITPSFRQKNELPENVVQMEHDGILGSCGEVTPTYPPQGYPTPPWAYSWHPCWNNMIPMALGSGLYSSNPNLLPWVSLQMVASPGFVPASYLGYMPSWNTPSNSPTLGKHSREANSKEEEKPEKCFWVPKTLRIDDPDEAAKSSIWATLGIKPNKKVPIKNGGIFKPFQHKTGGEVRKSDAAHVLQANPAAFSRSQTFQEST